MESIDHSKHIYTFGTIENFNILAGSTLLKDVGHWH